MVAPQPLASPGMLDTPCFSGQGSADLGTPLIRIFDVLHRWRGFSGNAGGSQRSPFVLMRAFLMPVVDRDTK